MLGMRRGLSERGRARPGGFFREQHPAQVIVLAFGLLILIGTLLLMLPMSRSGAGGPAWLTALFTATSSACVTGLIVVDTPAYWTTFGQVVILGLIQVGGFGIMTLASLLALVVSRRLGLRNRMVAQAEAKALGLGDLRTVLVGVAIITIAVETASALVLSLRFLLGYDYSVGRALYHGVFHSVSAFNNAGFALYSDNLVRFVTDPWITFGTALPVIIGGIGFPVLLELERRGRAWRRFSIHTKITLGMTAILLLLGTLSVLTFEWSNPGTLGPLSTGEKLMASFYQGTIPRTAGFNSLDYGAMNETTWLVTTVLMFIGGGSAGTAGGIKVTTFALFALVIRAEVRGEPNVNALGRRIPTGAQRQALSVALLAVGVVVGSTLILMAVGSFPLAETLFEAVSAFGTVGLSTGITGDFSGFGRLVLIALMFMGRVGPITLGAALALKEEERRYTLPEERPIIG